MKKKKTDMESTQQIIINRIIISQNTSLVLHSFFKKKNQSRYNLFLSILKKNPVFLCCIHEPSWEMRNKVNS